MVCRRCRIFLPSKPWRCEPFLANLRQSRRLSLNSATSNQDASSGENHGPNFEALGYDFPRRFMLELQISCSLSWLGFRSSNAGSPFASHGLCSLEANCHVSLAPLRNIIPNWSESLYWSEWLCFAAFARHPSLCMPMWDSCPVFFWGSHKSFRGQRSASCEWGRVHLRWPWSYPCANCTWLDSSMARGLL